MLTTWRMRRTPGLGPPAAILPLLVAVFATLTLSVGLTGDVAAAKTTITFWSHTHPPMVDYYKKLIAEYEKQNPDINIEYTVVPNNQFFTKMLTALSTGMGPDVMNMSSSQIATYSSKGVISPVLPEALGYKSQADLAKGWLPGTFQAVTFGGQIYGIPSEFNVSALLINTKFFKEAGLDPNKPPKTWDDVRKYSEALVKRQGDRIVRRGFDFPYLDNFYSQTFQILLMQNGGSVLNSDGTVATLNSEAGVKALGFWHDWVNKFKLGGPQYSLRDATNPAEDYASGKAAMFIAYPWVIPQVQANPEIWAATKIVPLPQVDPQHPVTFAYGYYWLVNKEARNKVEAWKFINFLASHPAGWLKEVGFIQPRNGWADTSAAEKFPFIDVWLSQMEVGNVGMTSVHNSEITASIRRAIENSIMNKMDPKLALDQAKQEIDKVISQK